MVTQVTHPSEMAAAGSPPASIGNFAIEARLGRGGMGEVWSARQHDVGTRVAVKLLLPDISQDAAHVQRFFNEARAVSGIQHAGIVKIFDVGYVAGRAYLIMELLEGETLASRIRRTGRLPLAQIADIGRQIASVLEATHLAGVTHRDLKPDNVFVVPDREQPRGERVKILDFGIAKLTGALAATSPRTLGLLGTPAYMAPEQWGDAASVDWRADLYALGCVVFEMACGRPPFVVTSLADACAKHLHDVPPRARSLVPSIPRALDELLAGMLAKAPEDRPTSLRDVMAAFDALASADPDALATGDTDALAATLAPTPSIRRRRWPRIATAVGTLAALAAFAAIALPASEDVAAAVDVTAAESTDKAEALRETTTRNEAAPAPASRVSAPLPSPASARASRPLPPPARSKSAAPEPLAPPTRSAPAPVGTVQVIEPPPGKDAALSDEPSLPDILAVLQPFEPGVAACAQPDSPETIGMELLIMPSGKLGRAMALGRHAHTPLGQCVSDAVIRARFPASRRGVTRRFTFSLR